MIVPSKRFGTALPFAPLKNICYFYHKIYANVTYPYARIVIVLPLLKYKTRTRGLVSASSLDVSTITV
ncbi:MAG TPA: hypothetical protein VLA13_05245, partial [Massilibacterium sp.]|nr:hypothetical protein [Massilibacterium sp.]